MKETEELGQQPVVEAERPVAGPVADPGGVAEVGVETSVKRRGRPRIYEGNVIMNLRLNPDERRVVEEGTAATGMSKTKWVRMAIMQCNEAKREPKEELIYRWLELVKKDPSVASRCIEELDKVAKTWSVMLLKTRSWKGAKEVDQPAAVRFLESAWEGTKKQVTKTRGRHKKAPSR